ncbi:Fc.00g090560.m01.CDS01 [Cosmosporella sp. VM-42]
MDPDCAICHAPATMACDCEAKGLEVAIKQAEDRMMRSIYNDIRSWVRAHAQDYILEYFRLLTERRKVAHTAHLDRITAHAYHYYHAPPHPNQIAEAQASLKRGIDEDWQASVQRYPEVLEYFFGLVELTLPAEDEPAVKEPPLASLNGYRKANRRSGSNGAPPPQAAIGQVEYEQQRQALPPRTPPPMPRMDRRTPAPQVRRGFGHHMPPPGPPPPAASYYAPY